VINGGPRQWGTRIPTSRTAVGIVFSCFRLQPRQRDEQVSEEPWPRLDLASNVATLTNSQRDGRKTYFCERNPRRESAQGGEAVTRNQGRVFED
jgi:hypothetical protein